MFAYIFENLDFGQYLKKKMILTKNFEHRDIDQNFQKCRF